MVCEKRQDNRAAAKQQQEENNRESGCEVKKMPGMQWATRAVRHQRVAELAVRIFLCRMLNITLHNTHPALQDREQWNQHFSFTTLRRTVVYPV